MHYVLKGPQHMSLKRMTIAVVASVAVFAGVSASAATLGGVKTDDVGANSNAVAGQLATNGGVYATFTTAYSATAGYYTITGVTLTPITAGDTIPIGAKVQLTLKGAANASLYEITSTLAAAATSTTGASLAVPGGTTIAAYDVQGVSVVVNGGAVTALVSTTK